MMTKPCLSYKNWNRSWMSLILMAEVKLHEMTAIRPFMSSDLKSKLYQERECQLAPEEWFLQEQSPYSLNSTQKVKDLRR